MNPGELHAVLTAYERGQVQGREVGVYENPYRDHPGAVGSAFKAGYDRGIADYCETEGRSDYGFNVGFAASQLAARVKNPAAVHVAYRVANAAMGIADVEATGIEWDGQLDDVLDAVAAIIPDADNADDLRRDAAEIARTQLGIGGRP